MASPHAEAVRQWKLVAQMARWATSRPSPRPLPIIPPPWRRLREDNFEQRKRAQAPPQTRWNKAALRHQVREQKCKGTASPNILLMSDSGDKEKMEEEGYNNEDYLSAYAVLGKENEPCSEPEEEKEEVEMVEVEIEESESTVVDLRWDGEAAFQAVLDERARNDLEDDLDALEQISEGDAVSWPYTDIEDEDKDRALTPWEISLTYSATFHTYFQRAYIAGQRYTSPTGFTATL